MKKILAVLVVVFAVTLCALSLRVPVAAQPATSPSSNSASQDQPAPPTANPNDPSETKTFTGKIVQSGDKLVLNDSVSKTTYQLDDQAKARAFLNKNVKVTGVLDASTSMIRVSAIEPA